MFCVLCVCACRSSICVVSVTNPIPDALELKPRVSNRRNFSLDFTAVGLKNPDSILLEAGQRLDVPLVFTPSKVDGYFDCMIRFRNEKVRAGVILVNGKWANSSNRLGCLGLSAVLLTWNTFWLSTPLPKSWLCMVRSSTLQNSQCLAMLRVWLCYIVSLTQQALPESLR